MTVNISFIKLKGNVIDNYEKSLKGWKNKDVTWEDIHKPMSSSKIQYSCYSWDKATKHPNNFNRDKQDCIVIDVDDGLSIVDFQAMFTKYRYVLATTKSHQKDKKGKVYDRYRVLIPAINIPTDNDVYWRTLELLFPFNDEQTLSPTASFLGHTDCIVIKHEGKQLDCFKASELASKQLKQEKADKVVIDKDLLPSYRGISLDTVKSELTPEIVREILESVGYEFEGYKFRLRAEERTASAKITSGCYIVDYGDKNAGGDIIDILKDYQGMSFREAIRYCSNFI